MRIEDHRVGRALFAFMCLLPVLDMLTDIRCTYAFWVGDGEDGRSHPWWTCISATVILLNFRAIACFRRFMDLVGKEGEEKVVFIWHLAACYMPGADAYVRAHAQYATEKAKWDGMSERERERKEQVLTPRSDAARGKR